MQKEQLLHNSILRFIPERMMAHPASFFLKKEKRRELALLQLRESRGLEKVEKIHPNFGEDNWGGDHKMCYPILKISPITVGYGRSV